MSHDVCPVKLLDKTRRLASICVSEFSKHGMSLNFSAGKTECLCSLKGKSSKELKQGLSDDGSLLLFESKGKSFQLRVVTQYKHMGGIVADTCSPGLEIGNRCHSAASSLSSLRKVLRSSKFSQETKFSLACSLVHTSLFYNMCTLSNMNAKQNSQISSLYMRTLREVTGLLNFGQKCDITFDNTVLSAREAVPSDALIVLARFRYLQKFLHQVLASRRKSAASACFICRLRQRDLARIVWIRPCFPSWAFAYSLRQYASAQCWLTGLA